MESTHPFSVSFAPCFQAVLCRSRLFFRMFLDKLFQICADRFIMKQKRRCFSPFLLSPSSRRAWIEISGEQQQHERQAVALLTEGVDRNTTRRSAWSTKKPVALLTEGVDRNFMRRSDPKWVKESPSSRRAWIEIPARSAPGSGRPPSPSSRRAWIEIASTSRRFRSWPRRPPHGGRG